MEGEIQALTCFTQCLGITCDNASPKDTMMEHLSEIITSFAGDSKCMQCFNHIITLVMKRLIHQFDIADKDADAAMDEAEMVLRELTEGMDIEEMLTQCAWDADQDDDDDDEGQGLEMLTEAHVKLNAST
jgi:hypothetical protein